MTKTQTWVAAFLGIFLLLFSISYFTKSDEAEIQHMGQDSEYQGGNSASSDQSGITLIRNNGCTGCHGSDLRGTNLAPSLMTVKNNWNSRDNLINYLRNPSSFSGDERFKEYKKRYTSIMPPYNNLDVKDLGKMADYLLGL